MNTNLPSGLRNSSQDNPLCTLEDILTIKGINILLNDFKPTEDDIELADFTYIEKSEKKVRMAQDDDTGEFHQYKYYFHDHLRKILLKQIKIAKSNIDKSYLASRSLEHKKTFISSIVEQLIYIHNEISRNGIAKKYVFLEKLLLDFFKYLTSKYSRFITEQSIQISEIDETHVLSVNEPEFKQENNKEIVEKIFKHFSGVNSNHETILYSGEYGRLITEILYLVNENKIKNDLRPFQVNGLSANSIKYSFYQLNKKIFPNGKIMDNYIHFLFKAFPSKFSNWRFDVLKTKFSQKPDKFPF